MFSTICLVIKVMSIKKHSFYYYYDSVLDSQIIVIIIYLNPKQIESRIIVITEH